MRFSFQLKACFSYRVLLRRFGILSKRMMDFSKYFLIYFSKMLFGQLSCYFKHHIDILFCPGWCKEMNTSSLCLNPFLLYNFLINLYTMIYFVSYQNEWDIWIWCILSKVYQPFLSILVTTLITNIINNDATVRVSVIICTQRLKSFLTRCITNLDLHNIT